MPTPRILAAALAAGALLSAAPAAGAFDLQAHRGGMGLRPESTLSSFGNAMRLGVTTLELDVQITQDEVAVVTHDRRVSPAPCRDTAPATPDDPEFPYVGKYVKDLTLAQVKTLECDRRIPPIPTQVAVPGSRMPTLPEVLALVKRYETSVMLNIETKVEAGAPHETAPREQFVQVTARDVRAAGMLDQVTIQSFDWGTLMRWREVEPRLPIVALTNFDFLQTGRPGASPWLGGIDIDDFGGDPIAAIESFGAHVFSPVHGFPQDGKVTDPTYRPYVTKAMVDHAHDEGVEVIPWTVDDGPTMAKLIDDGVDGIITNRPDVLRDVMRDRGLRLPRGGPSPFDVQGHRGARAVRPENTLAAFRYALDNPGVSTLELDTGVTRDGHLVVLHDRTINGEICADTGPVRPRDPRFPYVGKRVHDLTLRQVKTLDCGSGERIPALDEVFALVRASGRRDVRLNIETKISPLVRDTAPYRVFTWKLVRAIARAGFARRATIQSFDWRTIRLARRLDPRIETVALVWQFGPAECRTLADECSLRAVYDDPSVKSPWTAGLDWWRYRDLARLVRAADAGTVSANWEVHDPDGPFFHGPPVAGLQTRGLKVVPYTINDEPTMQRMIELGVDGIISDDPDRLVAVAKRNGLR